MKIKTLRSANYKIKKEIKIHRVWGHTPVISALGGLRQED
jgi:hypothetical protein